MDTLTLDLQGLTDQIVSEFRGAIGDSVVLDQEQQELVTRAADRIARTYLSQVVVPSEDSEAVEENRFIMESSTAVLENIKLANELDAQTVFKQSVERVFTRVLSFGFAVLRMYVAGLTGLPPIVPIAPVQ
jgi:hypothetical protein